MRGGDEKVFDNSKQNPVSCVFILDRARKSETELTVSALTKQGIALVSQGDGYVESTRQEFG
jgi:hypothetical protein